MDFMKDTRLDKVSVKEGGYLVEISNEMQRWKANSH